MDEKPESGLGTQAYRLSLVEKELEELKKHFAINGFLWQMSRKIERLISLSETSIAPAVEKTSAQMRWMILAILGLVGIVGALLGTHNVSGP
jgi:hypothetical protein